jgi:O-antigen ligase
VLLGGCFWYIQRGYDASSTPFDKTVLATSGALLAMICTINFLSDMIETDKVGSLFYMVVAVVAGKRRIS